MASVSSSNVSNDHNAEFDMENYYDEAEGWEFSAPWIMELENVLLAFSCAGVLINVVCFIILTVMLAREKFQSKRLAFLLQQQAVADFLVCALTIPIKYNDQRNLASSSPWKEIECLFWYSQFFYWWAMLLSAFNLMLIAVYWLLEVLYGDKDVNLRRILAWSLFTIHICALGGAVPCVFSLMIVRNGACLQPLHFHTDALQGMYYSWMGAWLFFAYIIPLGVAAACYGYMIYFYKRLADSLSFGPQRTDALKKLCHMFKCIASIVVFTLFVGLDSVDWLLEAIEVAEYIFNSPRQKFSVLLLSVNSVFNPLLHVVFSSDVHNYVKTLYCCFSLAPDPEPVRLSNVYAITLSSQASNS